VKRVLRDAEWLNPDRARAWCVILATLSLIGALGWIGLSSGGLDRLGKPLGTDFVSYWTASRLALDGTPGLAYDPAAHMTAQRALFPAGRPDYYAFFYPPTFLLICLPLALLPYLPALVIWLAAGFLAVWASLRELLPQRWAILPIVAFPAMLVNAGHGQNGFWTAACFGGGLAWLERRPMLAGMCLGALAIKPQLAMAVPVGLLAARRWSAVAGAALSSVGLCALSWLVLGDAAWRGFLDATGLARATLEAGLVEPAKMQSAFAAVRLLGGVVTLAYGVQAAVALAAMIVLGRVALRRPGAAAEIAVLVAATLLCTPFLLDYDLVCLALPLAWLMAEAQRGGWRPWERIVLLVAYMLPVVSRPLAMATFLPVAPVAMAALLAVAARRAGGTARP
jgi:hypothetical protein